MSRRTLRVNVLNRGDGIEIQTVSSHQGKRPSKRQMKQETVRFLIDAVKGLQSGEVHYGGAAEDDRKRLRRDDWLIEGGKGEED